MVAFWYFGGSLHCSSFPNLFTSEFPGPAAALAGRFAVTRPLLDKKPFGKKHGNVMILGRVDWVLLGLNYSTRRKFRSQTSDTMDRWKSRGGKSRVREEKRRREKIREEKEWKERRCRCAKGRKVAIHCVFSMICGSGEPKSRLAKAAGDERWKVARRCVKDWHDWRFRCTLGSWDVQKVHVVVARTTCPSQNVQSAPFPDHCWKLRCRKSTRRCGVKHMSKSKC